MHAVRLGHLSRNTHEKYGFCVLCSNHPSLVGKEADGKVLLTVSGKTSGRILEAILQNNAITIPELSILIGITERSVERNLQKLQKGGALKRIGPAKDGHWLVS